MELGERLARVEEQVKGVREDLKEIKESLRDYKKNGYGKIGQLRADLTALQQKTNPHLTGRERAAIWVAFIAGVSSILSTIIMAAVLLQ